MLNWKIILKIISVVLIITGVSMIPSWATAIIRDSSLVQSSFLASILTCLFTGFLLWTLLKKSQGTLKLKDGYMVVALSWLLASLFGALPYFLSWGCQHPIDAIFESVSGFTTTGATVIDIDMMDKSLLLWKATESWLGGMGILVFAISILPTLGINGQTIVQAETPGPAFEKMTARVSASTKILYFTYGLFTFLEFGLLLLSPKMNAFDALINTFGSVSTGGIFAHSQGLAYYDSIYIEGVIGSFCFLGSISFLLYFTLLNRKIKLAFKNTELRVFAMTILIASLIIGSLLSLFNTYDSSFTAFRLGLFQVVSTASTAGYGISNYYLWPGACQVILFFLMFAGGCASSTSGGLKMIRVITAFKIMGRMFFKRLHPAGIAGVRVSGKAMSTETVSRIASFMFLYFFVFFISCIVLSLENLDPETSFGVAIGALSNTGLGLGPMGATGNYSMFGPHLRLYLSALMLMGRLELFTIFLLFMPSFWRDR